MCCKLDKHKQNDQNKKNTFFWKVYKKKRTIRISLHENCRQKSKSKQIENETVFLERKMFWKVDKHKQNDQSGIVHPFGKSTKKTNKHKQNDQNKKNTSFWKAYNNNNE